MTDGNYDSKYGVARGGLGQDSPCYTVTRLAEQKLWSTYITRNALGMLCTAPSNSFIDRLH